MAETHVVHCKRERYDVYIGRPSKWGSPFAIKPSKLAREQAASVEEALEKYEAWVRSQPELMAALPELRGKVLGCWCKPSGGFGGRVLCHGQILAGMADGIPAEEIS